MIFWVIFMYAIISNEHLRLKVEGLESCFGELEPRQIKSLTQSDVIWVRTTLAPGVEGYSRVTLKKATGKNHNEPVPKDQLYFEGKGHTGTLGNNTIPYRIVDYGRLERLLRKHGPEMTVLKREDLALPETERQYNSLLELLKKESMEKEK